MSYIIKAGDTLYKIAKRATGDGDRWNELWRHNMLNLRSRNHEVIYPGETLSLPPEWPDWGSRSPDMAKPTVSCGCLKGPPETIDPKCEGGHARNDGTWFCRKRDAPRGSITNEGPIEFDTSINRSDGSIAFLSIAQTLKSGKRMRVVLNRDDLARLIARINGSLIYIHGEFKLIDRPEKSK